MSVFWAIVWLVLTFGSHNTNWAVMITLGVCLVVIAAWANVVAIKGGVYESDAGLTLRSLFSSVHYEWKHLDGFEHRRRGTHDLVYARLADGSRRRMMGVLQGQQIIWDDGQTKDIVAVLSERLAAKQAHCIDS